MHAVEAYIAAYEATHQPRYLHRARLIAHNLARCLTAIVQRDTGLPLIYEHYNSTWTAVDVQYNEDKPDDVFKPWGFQPGHLTEWARLLLQLDAHRSSEPWADDSDSESGSWYVDRARQLFDAAVQYGWDEVGGGGGLVYSFTPRAPYAVCSADKYKWVSAESLATAARLAVVTGDAAYWQWYERLWQWSWQHLIDHTYGGWYRLVGRDGKRLDELKSPPGKVDYHSTGACRDVLATLSAAGGGL